MKAALLPDRGVVKVSGDDARTFLNGLVTSDTDALAPGQGRYAALLTPQGKIVVDFLVTAAQEGAATAFYLDCPRDHAKPLAQKLGFYKLRAKVAVEDASGGHGVFAVWDDAPSPQAAMSFPDPRLPGLGTRIIAPVSEAAELPARLGADSATAEDYHRERIVLGVPQGGIDFVYGDAFPHEADMDQLHGVDFKKGCYVGQEVVSRMEHRGTARTRIVSVTFDGPAPATGTEIVAGGKTLGRFGSSADGRALALVRLDRVADALAAGDRISAGDATLTVSMPPWARFALPGAMSRNAAPAAP